MFAATLALATTPALAAAEEPLIPPGNSAVNQYTESIPTSRGGKDAEQRRERSPKQVLGSKNAKRLESHGADGREAAEVAAETAPVAGAEQEVDVEAEADEEEASPGGTGDGAGGRGGETPPRNPRPTTAQTVNVEEPEGSSGLGEVLAGATGSTDSGETGPLLPLLILLALAGSIAYALRQRRAVGR